MEKEPVGEAPVGEEPAIRVFRASRVRTASRVRWARKLNVGMGFFQWGGDRSLGPVFAAAAAVSISAGAADDLAARAR